jgi:hypothetical protein
LVFENTTLRMPCTFATNAYIFLAKRDRVENLGTEKMASDLTEVALWFGLNSHRTETNCRLLWTRRQTLYFKIVRKLSVTISLSLKSLHHGKSFYSYRIEVALMNMEIYVVTWSRVVNHENLMRCCTHGVPHGHKENYFTENTRELHYPMGEPYIKRNEVAAQWKTADRKAMQYFGRTL